jgi:tetratricopeptide (TPR) repeat protein
MNAPLAKASLLSVLSALSMSCALQSLAQSEGDFARGVAEFRAGNYSSATALLEHAEAVSPGTTDALLFEGKALIHLSNFPAAEQALQRYLKSHPASSDALYLLGFVLHRQNRPAESLAAYTRAAAINAPTGDDLKVVGLDYVLLDNYADAIKWLQSAVERDPKNKDAWYYLGRALYTKSRFAEARQAFLTVLSLDPYDAKAENNLGLIYETEGQAPAAMEAYRKAIAWQEQSLHPSEQPYVNLGNLLMEQGQAKEALASLQKAVGLAPNNAFCHMTLGIAYRQDGTLDQAQAELEAATKLEPDNPTAHYQLGRLYKEQHALDRARAEFEKTAELKTRSAGLQTASPNR